VALLYYGRILRGCERFPERYYVPIKCSAEACAEVAVAPLDERQVCRAHFLAGAYAHLECIAAQIQEPQFHSQSGELASRFLEQCMRDATNIACAAEVLNNLERAQLLDILLWASELYGRLRRGRRVRARIPILVRSEEAQKPWEEKTETLQLSSHGFSFICRHEVRSGDALTCVRLDSGRRAGARVVWARCTESGENEAGVEFSTDEDFWGLEVNVATPVFPSKVR
jgi:PilZ domain